jgi:putative transposase
MLRVAVEEDARAELALGLDEICREGARQMLAKALELEVEAYVSAFTQELDDRGHRLVVRNGHAEPRMVATGAGPIEVTVPRVNDKRIDEASGERRRFSSSIIAPGAGSPPRSPRCCRSCTCTG